MDFIAVSMGKDLGPLRYFTFLPLDMVHMCVSLTVDIDFCCWISRLKYVIYILLNQLSTLKWQNLLVLRPRVSPSCQLALFVLVSFDGCICLSVGLISECMCYSLYAAY